MSEYPEVDQVLKDSLMAVSAALDLDLSGKAIQDCLEAVSRQAAALKAAKYRKRSIKLACPGCKSRFDFQVPSKPEEVARAMSHTGKVLDEIVRLAAFAKGQPDSRPDTGGDVLRGLTDEQIQIVNGWLTANAARR